MKHNLKFLEGEFKITTINRLRESKGKVNYIKEQKDGINRVMKILRKNVKEMLKI